jgi:membrane protein
MAGIWRNLPFLLRRTVVGAGEDGCYSIAKGAAYSALLSFFPILTSAATILVQARADFVRAQITGFLSTILPPGTEDAVIVQFTSRGNKPIGLLIAANLLSLWAASSVIKSLIEGFHAAYRVPRDRTFFHQSGVAILLVFAAGLPFAIASALILFGQESEGQVLQLFRVDPILNPLAEVWEFFSRMARYVVAIGATISLTTILYYYGPYRKQRLTRVIPGAIFATILWTVVTWVFGLYVRNVVNYNVLYGSIGSGIALLVWMYLLSVIAILGCEFNAEYERMLAIEM